MLQNPIELKKDKKFGVLFWKSKPLTATLTINKQAFVSGENILISGIIDNESDVKIKHCEIKMKKNVVYRARGRSKYDSSTVYEARQPEINKADRAVWNSVPIFVPCLPPSGLDGCGIIDVSYFVEVRIVPPGVRFALELVFNITIGTVPFRQMGYQPTGGYANTPQNQPGLAPPGYSNPAPGPSGNWEMVGDNMIAGAGGVAPPYQQGGPGGVAPPYQQGGPGGVAPPYPTGDPAPYPQKGTDGMKPPPTAPGPAGTAPQYPQPTFGDYGSGGGAAPPSYDSLFKGEGGEDDDDISRNYVPKYPSYSIQPSAPPKS